MILGTALIFGALSLFLFNRREVQQAEQASMDLMPQLLAAIEEKEESGEAPQSYEQQTRKKHCCALQTTTGSASACQHTGW